MFDQTTRPQKRDDDDVKIKRALFLLSSSFSLFYLRRHARGGSYFTIVLIFAIAFAGFNPFGHTFVQFIIV